MRTNHWHSKEGNLRREVLDAWEGPLPSSNGVRHAHPLLVAAIADAPSSVSEVPPLTDEGSISGTSASTSTSSTSLVAVVPLCSAVDCQCTAGSNRRKGKYR